VVMRAHHAARARAIPPQTAGEGGFEIFREVGQDASMIAEIAAALR
jgi:hypothetical protein